MLAAKQHELPWYRRTPVIIVFVVVAFGIGVGSGSGEADDAAEFEREIAQLADERDELETALDQRPSVSEVEQLEERVAELEGKLEQARDEADSATEPEPEPATGSAPEGGCEQGQVDINSAGIQELQRIHEIGPERAGQIVDLRPFGSVDELTRVSGIAEGRLGGIKAQGLACVG
ncbi:helix-hairpin-helix domain-containing protein [Haloechinothrix sp. LS1_15]|uniref:ComEA family DNA-binding protein n=1 Tax=Haloechinothrix sp. LS1_15 TaxID=2652248 RepID=UPI0029461743|nr:helix-hairpin-helix domain-containing protein [Haloechinothrix sp. LS1_15]MDV6010953.1 hypothetical protein [Haloechinothrix sp. LS1_15]